MKCHQYVLVFTPLFPLVWLVHFSTLQTNLFCARANMMLGSSQSDSFSLPTLGRKIPGKGSNHPSISHVYIPGPVIESPAQSPCSSLWSMNGACCLKNGGKVYWPKTFPGSQKKWPPWTINMQLKKLSISYLTARRE